MRTISLLSIGLLLSAFTATAVFAQPDPTLPYGTSQQQIGDPNMPNNSTVPAKGKTAEKTLCPDKNMPMKLAVQPNTNYQEKGVQSSEQGKTLYQLKKEHHDMRDQMTANADCIPKK
jgi:hypothetical protein